MSVPTHKSKHFHGFSTEFVSNAALFSASKESYDLGNFHKVNLPFQRIFVVNDPSVLHHILVANEAKYEKSKIYWHQLRQIIGKALGSVEGDEWMVLKHLQKPFYTRTAVEGYLNTVDSLSSQYISNWQTGKPIDLLHQLAVLNMVTVMTTVFGIEVEENPDEFARMIADGEAFIAWRSKFPWRPFLSYFTPTWQKTKRNLAFLSRFADKIVQKRQGSKSRNMTDALIDNGYGTEHIRNELIVHLGASTETVAVAEGWVLYILGQNPDVLAQVRAEIADITKGGQVTAQHTHQFTYLTAVVKEAMRLYPPSHAIVRDCVAPEGDIIQTQRIEPGDTVYISAYGLHRNPQFWERADEFDPNRFLGQNESKIPAYAYIPFGGGKHTCIGRYLAMPMMLLTLAKIIEKYDFEMLGKAHKKPISLSTLKPEDGFWMKLSKRKVLYSI